MSAIPEEIQNDYTKAEKIVEDFKSNLNKRTEKTKNRMNTQSEDAKLKFQLDNLLSIINQIKLKSGDNPQMKHHINKLFSNYGEFKKQMEKFSTANDDFSMGRYSNKMLENENMNREQYEVYKEQKFKESDHIFDELKGTAKLIKNGAIQIRDEIELHNPLLDRLERNIDKVDSKMKRSENKLANYLKKSSDNCLYWTILIEFIFLILFFVM